MTTEEKIIDYFARRRIMLDSKAAKYLIKLVREDADPDGTCFVVKHKHTYMRTNDPEGTYEPFRSARIPYKKVMTALSIRVVEVKKSYLYSIYSPSGTLLKDIYTMHANLFEEL